jgi:hypothetical protein
MSILASIVRDLDFETYHPDASSSGGKPDFASGSLSALYSEFSSALALFNHNLLAYRLLTPKLQVWIKLARLRTTQIKVSVSKRPCLGQDLTVSEQSFVSRSALRGQFFLRRLGRNFVPGTRHLFSPSFTRKRLNNYPVVRV